MASMSPLVKSRFAPGKFDSVLGCGFLYWPNYDYSCMFVPLGTSSERHISQKTSGWAVSPGPTKKNIKMTIIFIKRTKKKLNTKIINSLKIG